MLRAAAFIKRLATFALSFGSAEAIAGLFWRSGFCLPHPYLADACEASITFKMIDINKGGLHGTLVRTQEYLSLFSLSVGTISIVLYQTCLNTFHY
jgi:hypothetical protein